MKAVPHPHLALLAAAFVQLAFGCKPPPPPLAADSGAGLLTALPSDSGLSTAAPSDAGVSYARPYSFSEDWFSDRVPSWSQFLAPVRGKPDLRYLEIGVFEGRSALWMLENILTHPSARMTCVDIFLGNTRAVWDSNLAKSGLADKVTTIQGPSHVELRKLELGSFDIIYIDGSHTADDVLADAVLAWGLLREGGTMIFDDYAWSGRLRVGEAPTPDELRPGVAIDAFVTAYRNNLEVVLRDWQLVVRKHGGLCGFKEACTPIGDYEYHWWAGELFRRSDRGKVSLTEREKQVLEALLRSRRFGQARYEPDATLKAQPEYAPLLERLGLKL